MGQEIEKNLPNSLYICAYYAIWLTVQLMIVKSGIIMLL